MTSAHVRRGESLALATATCARASGAGADGRTSGASDGTTCRGWIAARAVSRAGTTMRVDAVTSVEKLHAFLPGAWALMVC
jgi:hypothetical protein